MKSREGLRKGRMQLKLAHLYGITGHACEPISEKRISENIFTRSLKLLSSLNLVTNSLRNTITRFLLDNEKNN